MSSNQPRRTTTPQKEKRHSQAATAPERGAFARTLTSATHRTKVLDPTHERGAAATSARPLGSRHRQKRCHHVYNAACRRDRCPSFQENHTCAAGKQTLKMDNTRAKPSCHSATRVRPADTDVGPTRKGQPAMGTRSHLDLTPSASNTLWANCPPHVAGAAHALVRSPKLHVGAK